MIVVNEMTIAKWEKGRTKPTIKNLEKIRRILEFEI